MVIYYSGNGGSKADPENVLGDRATIMLTYFKAYVQNAEGKAGGRFAAILEVRRKRLAHKKDKK